MKDRKLYLYWLYVSILCAALGFIPSPRSPLITALLTLAGIAFFIPPAMILHRAIKKDDPRAMKRIAILSLISLGLTFVLFIGNTLSVLAPKNLLLGNILNALLVLFSVPMMCLPYQFLGMFGWACLLFTVIFQRRKKPKDVKKQK